MVNNVTITNTRAMTATTIGMITLRGTSLLLAVVNISVGLEVEEEYVEDNLVVFISLFCRSAPSSVKKNLLIVLIIKSNFMYLK